MEQKARNFARRKHAGQLDDSGKPYFTAHILQVVRILKLVTDDEELITSAYLHDTLEDTNTTYEEILQTFGKKVANLVLEVTHEGKKDNIGYYYPHLHTLKAYLLKFADRLSNLSRMEAWNQKRQQQYMKKSVFWRKQGK